MRSKAHFIHHRRAVNLADAGGNVVDVVVTWSEWPDGTPVDPVNGNGSGEPVLNRMEVRALVHYVGAPGVTEVRQFNEVETGDCILDLDPGVAVDGKPDIRFQIDGEEWVPKKVGSKLARSWDTVVGGERLFRSLLLKKAV